MRLRYIILMHLLGYENHVPIVTFSGKIILHLLSLIGTEMILTIHITIVSGYGWLQAQSTANGWIGHVTIRTTEYASFTRRENRIF